MMNGKQSNYCYPGTDILINNYDIQQEADLIAKERQITSIRIAELENKEPQKDGYNFKKLCEIHHYIFFDMYAWAGKPRTIDISKGTSLFCRAAFINDAAQDIFSRLKKDNYLQGLEKTQFIDKLADYITDVNVLHPFREGNGRTQRTFFRELALAAGYNLDFEKTDKETAIAADLAAMNGKTDILKSMLQKIVSESSTEREPQKHQSSRLEAIRQKGKEYAENYKHDGPSRKSIDYNNER